MTFYLIYFYLGPLGLKSGTKYCKACAIAAGIRHATTIFGELNKVLILDLSEVLLQFVTHLNAYEVKRQNEMSYIKQSDLEAFQRECERNLVAMPVSFILS